MENVARAWHERRGEVLAQKEAILTALSQQQALGDDSISFSAAPLETAVNDLAQAFDSVSLHFPAGDYIAWPVRGSDDMGSCIGATATKIRHSAAFA